MMSRTIGVRWAGVWQLSLLAVTIAGCASSNFTRLKDYPAKPEDCHIEVLASTPTDRPYEDVCLLNAKSGKTFLSDKSSEALIEDLKKTACKCGADAIVIRLTEGGGGTVFEFDQAKADAIAIRFLD
jgi:hypothetical protein